VVEFVFTRRFLHYGYAFGRNDEFMENSKKKILQAPLFDDALVVFFEGAAS